MRDRGQKFILGAAGCLGFAAGPAFLFKQARVVYGQRDPIGTDEERVKEVPPYLDQLTAGLVDRPKV